MSDLEDPRVFFAAERTGLAWLRTSITLMGFGFVIEKFGFFIRYIKPNEPIINQKLSLLIGILFIVAGSVLSLLSAYEHKKFLISLNKKEIPLFYLKNLVIISNLIVSLLGLFLIIYILFTNQI
jgi:putative membrane protein